MANLLKQKKFQLSSLDRHALDPDNGGYSDIDWWYRLYFDGELFPWQQYFYHHPSKDKMVVAGIRTGKSFVAAVGILHYLFYHPYARALNTSISSEQAKIVWHTMMELCTRDRFKHWIDHVEKSPYPLIRLVNGSEAWFRSIGYEAELIRGFEFDLINIDEAAYVQSDLAIQTLRGRLLGVNPRTNEPRAGLLWQTTSPKGKLGWLYERWKKGDPRFPQADPQHYLSLRVRTNDNPKLSAEMLASIMADYTDKMIRQELEGEFLDDSGHEFEPEQVAQCYDESRVEVKVIYQEIERWREIRQQKSKSLKSLMGMSEDLTHFELPPKAGHQYIASWDLGKKPTKSGRNATVGMVFDITELPWKMAAFRYEEGREYLTAATWIEDWHLKYSNRSDCYTVIDASGKGDVLNEYLETESRIPVDGLVYSGVLKSNLVTSAKLAVERGMVVFPFIKRFVDQLNIYEQNDRDLPQDTVMAFAQAMHRAREMTGVTTSSLIATNRPRVYRRQSPIHTPLAQRYVERRRGSLHRTGF